MTEFWNRFGKTILGAPDLTLAAFLGDRSSIEVAKQHDIRFPKTTDFQIDSAYDPNFHKLDLDEERLQTDFFILCVSAWGVDALRRAVNACSLIQCMHQTVCSPRLLPVRNQAAFALQTFIDTPSKENRDEAASSLKKCSDLYRVHEDSPDTPESHNTWYQLGAPWLALESVFSMGGPDASIDEVEPAQCNSTWIARESVWPRRAFDAAAHWSSHSLVRDVVRSTLLKWAVSRSRDESNTDGQ